MYSFQLKKGKIQSDIQTSAKKRIFILNIMFSQLLRIYLQSEEFQLFWVFLIFSYQTKNCQINFYVISPKKYIFQFTIKMLKVIEGAGSKKYKLEKIIGQGSFGKVYLSGQYAVKQISLDLPPYLKTSLQTQIKILKSFNHPNIVSLIDVIYESKYVYIVMQYCMMDLSKYIKSGKINESKAKNILKQIIAGFNQLVQKGIIHRDLKPANILVNSKGQFKLADFGFAKYVDHFDSKLLHSIVGTPLYMAPQILKKSKYTTKCDIWSIGFIYYQLVTSKLPWNGNSQNQLYNNIMKKPLMIPEYVSEWSANLLKKMLVPNQNDRIGWDELIKYVLTSQKTNSSDGQNSDRRSPSIPKIIEQKNSLKKAPQPTNKLSVKTSDLIALFQLQLLQFFSQQKAHTMVTDKNYRFSVSEIGYIKKILGNFTLNYQNFIQTNFNLKL